MTLYIFHVDDGGTHVDDERIELRNITEARRQAADLAGRTLVGGAASFWDGQPWSVRVTDDHGLALFELHLTASSAPATIGVAKPLR